MAKKKQKRGTASPSAGGFGLPASPGLGGAPTYSAQPAPPVNPYVSQAPPIDPQFEAYKVTAGRNVALGNADATYQNARIENSYGLGSDQSNPYSQAKMLEESYKRSTRGTDQSYAGMGQLYAGSRQVAQGENQHQYSIGYDQLARGYQDAKYGVIRGQAQTAANYGVGVDDAQWQSILKGLG